MDPLWNSGVVRPRQDPEVRLHDIDSHSFDAKFLGKLLRLDHAGTMVQDEVPPLMGQSARDRGTDPFRATCHQDPTHHGTSVPNPLMKARQREANVDSHDPSGMSVSQRRLEMATAPPRPRSPEWFRTRLPTGAALKGYQRTLATVNEGTLHTVCQEARCPNIHECWSEGDATFMVAGQSCTRGCGFCAVGTIKTPPPLEEDEPGRIAEAVHRMGLRHVVITVVNRDDLPDSGAGHYRACIEATAARNPEVSLELLCSDLAGDHEALSQLLVDLPLEVFAQRRMRPSS